MKIRCAWAAMPFSIAYHDAEWGVLLHDDLQLFEFLILEGARAGDVAVITGALGGNERSGASTRFVNFQAIQLYKRYGVSNGGLQGEADRLTEHSTGLWTRDLVAEAEFVSPSGSNWDYGFVIRNPEVTRLDVAGVTDEGRWFHNARSAGSGGYVDMAKGDLTGSKASIGGKNHVMLLAFGGTGLFLFNGQMVARLDLSHNQDKGGVSVIANFFSGHQGSPSFSNLNVWTP